MPVLPENPIGLNSSIFDFFNCANGDISGVVHLADSQARPTAQRSIRRSDRPSKQERRPPMSSASGKLSLLPCSAVQSSWPEPPRDRSVEDQNPARASELDGKTFRIVEKPEISKTSLTTSFRLQIRISPASGASLLATARSTRNPELLM